MERSDILDGYAMIDQCSHSEQVLTSENEELKELSNAFSTIGMDTALKGDASDAFRQQIMDYKNLVDSEISVNLFDLKDIGTVKSETIPFYYDGNEIIQNQIDAQTAKDYDEVKKNYHYNEWMNSNILNAVEGAYHFYLYLYYEGCVNNDEALLDYWKSREVEYDSINKTTSELFANSVSTRKVISEALSSLADNYADGNYKTELNADWRLRLVEELKEFYYSYDSSGNKEYDFQLIYDKMNNSEELSDQEFDALISALDGMGVHIGGGCSREEIKTIVESILLDKMYSNLYNTSGEYVSSPFDQLSYEERALYVLIYEEKHPQDAASMENIASQFEADAYLGWETDVNNIKFLAYTANEPYKSLFLKYAPQLKYLDFDWQATQHYSSTDGGIYLDHTAMNGTAASYNTFFHESAHNIDAILGRLYDPFDPNSSAYTRLYSVEGVTFTDTLYNEVNKRIDEKISAYEATFGALTDEQKAQVYDSILNMVDAHMYGYAVFEDPDAETAYYYVRDAVWADLKGRGTARDIYGGLSGNTFAEERGYAHQALKCEKGRVDENGNVVPSYRVYWIEGGINYTDGTDFYVYLEDGTDPGLKIDAPLSIDDPDNKNNTLDNPNFAQQIINSDYDVKYKNSIASECFAESVASNMTRESGREHEAYSYYYADTTDYIVTMISEAP